MYDPFFELTQYVGLNDFGDFAPQGSGWPVLGLHQLQGRGSRLRQRLWLGLRVLANLLVAVGGTLVRLQVAGDRLKMNRLMSDTVGHGRGIKSYLQLGGTVHLVERFVGEQTMRLRGQFIA